MSAYICCFNVFSCLQTESPEGHMCAVTKFSLHSLMEVLGKAGCIYVLSVIGGVPARKKIVIMLKENEMEVNEIAKKGWP